MPRVSQHHLDARRRQILDGAARCFARNGFHATSMADVLRETGLSAGAVYRYFRGKDELIEAIVTEVLEAIRTTFEAAARQSPPPPPDVLVGQVMTEVLTERSGLSYDGEESFPRLMIQVWTETLRNDDLSAVMRAGYLKVRESWVRVVLAYQQAGLMRDDIPADRVARTMIAAAQGFAAQQALFGSAPVSVLQDGLRALMSMGGQSAS
ncbi:TetR/AcrR family transcriptional regulator [Streptomyces sp. WAC05374]|uniref:TetR/AcrR family transcriptional regulator n=1 Tax=unclassified Streptomyces TaxID=2593676 RepID=UPI000F861585|nr:TetR/AcrR family transcriptional regulator [Streptomyces sp. WAC05374]RST16047.1 TetR/AcrR family transcriptional regulator [Streptomyces sp. WAC05374]TDF50721.1 TetR/AcrR family transcriptional regulator [Streptomyces sp. WAC05374]TDF57011.1 TetR/AcrR family transcriptional regulator [Streptomyces sp. WAC05374]TDF60973.1 TetR/AcrR family transcriptional regulator [Streptomyces sp. WAC05374]